MGHGDHLDHSATTALLTEVNFSQSHNGVGGGGGGGGGSNRMGVDEALQKYCSEFGPWQLKQFVLTSLAWVLTAFHIMVVVFADRKPAWRCTEVAASEGRCSGGVDLCQLQPGSWEWVEGKGSSTVAEWGLVCGDKFLAGVAQSVFFAGSMIGCGVFGHLSDSFMGRKGALTLAYTMNAVLGSLTALSPSYAAYASLRFLTGLGSGGSVCAFLLATEPVGPTKRGAAGMCTFYFFSTGCVLLACIAHSYPAWRTIYVLSSLPSLLFVLVVLPFVAESPRWLLTRGRSTEALATMAAIAKCNGRDVFPDDISLVLLDYDNSTSGGNTTVPRKAAASGSIIDAIRSPTTRSHLLSALLINFFGSVVYYGLTLNVANLKTNLYANVILNAVSEIPAYALATILMKWLGRKPLLIGSIWLSGVFCLVGSFLQYGNASRGELLRMGCGVVGIFAISAMFNLFFVYTMELFPTVVRNAALGCVTLAGQTGAILAPMVVALGGDVPFTVFGVCGVVGGFFAFLLPETANKPLYDTFGRCRGIQESE